jgi:hypothetical protein
MYRSQSSLVSRHSLPVWATRTVSALKGKSREVGSTIQRVRIAEESAPSPQDKNIRLSAW